MNEPLRTWSWRSCACVLLIVIGCGDPGSGGGLADTAPAGDSAADTTTDSAEDATTVTDDDAIDTAAPDTDPPDDTSAPDDTSPVDTVDTTAPDDNGPADVAEDTADVAEDTADTAVVGDTSGDVAVVDAGPGTAITGFALARAALTWTADPPLPTEGGFGVGVDLGLHLMVQTRAQGQDIDGDRALDGWYDATWDCSWFTPETTWGAALDIDDTCCGGPENIVYSANGMLGDDDALVVGVEVWEIAPGWTGATARVTLFGEDGAMIELDVELSAGQFWEVAVIDRDGLRVLDDGAGGPWIYAFTQPF